MWPCRERFAAAGSWLRPGQAAKTRRGINRPAANTPSFFCIRLSGRFQEDRLCTTFHTYGIVNLLRDLEGRLYRKSESGSIARHSGEAVTNLHDTACKPDLRVCEGGAAIAYSRTPAMVTAVRSQTPSMMPRASLQSWSRG